MECTSWSFLIHFGVHLCFRSLTNGQLGFFYQLFRETGFFSLSLMLFGGRIDDLCNGCFDGNFALLGVVRVGVIDPMCVFV